MNAQDTFQRETADVPNLSSTEKGQLLRIARETLTEYLTAGTIPEYEVKESGLIQEVAAFVTLRGRDGELRGCIGRVEVSQPLYQSVQDCVISAATNDFRFSPVTAAELDQLLIEISVLSPFRLISDLSEIQIGRHGLLIRKDFRVGLLLPQVASERDWSREEFLHAICIKAGLPSDSYVDADLYVFCAEVFGEQE